MVFNSLTFLAFFAVVLGLHALPIGWRYKKINLLVASYLFYAAWNPPFVILLWISTIVDWFAAQALVRSESQAARRAWMLTSVVANLGMLGFFKYGQFLVDSFTAVVSVIGIHYRAPQYDIVLPIGISFYTFATMSYTLDVYLRRATPARSFLDYALFVTFFPHLVAGPIMRPTELVPQFATPHRASRDQLCFGLLLLTLGLFEKCILADGFLSDVVQTVYDSTPVPGTLDAWAATLAFSGQIFCDFAGYSTCAIGAALCLGFAMPDNFRFPYAAVGFSDFWRRWHITLSSWLRDYLYIPLGGSRNGQARTYAALFGTMLIGGLWHGASWTFVVWGGLHGVYLAGERALRTRFKSVVPGVFGQAGLALLTFLLVSIAWVFFRARTFAKANIILGGMTGQNSGAPPALSGADLISVAVIVSGIVGVHWLMRNRTLEGMLGRLHPVALAAGWTGMAFCIITEHGAGSAFIYFQF